MAQPLDPEKFRNLPPGVLERLNKQRAQTEAEIAQRKANHFQLCDRVSGARNPDGTIIPQPPIDLKMRVTKGTNFSAQFFNIYKYQDGHGNIVYLIPTGEKDEGSQDHVKALSDSITAQQDEFQRLDPKEQKTLMERLDLFGNPSGRFGTYLKNEALGDLFAKLK